jgi:hypothetical protein
MFSFDLLWYWDRLNETEMCDGYERIEMLLQWRGPVDFRRQGLCLVLDVGSSEMMGSDV